MTKAHGHCNLNAGVKDGTYLFYSSDEKRCVKKGLVQVLMRDKRWQFELWLNKGNSVITQ